MDIKRLFLAFSLSFIFIITWGWFVPPATTIEKVLPTVEEENIAVIESNYEGSSQKINLNYTKNQDIVNTNNLIDTDLMSMNLIRGGTSISKLEIVEKNKKNTLRHKGAWSINSENYFSEMPVKLLDSQACNPCLLIDDSKTPLDFELTNSPQISNNTTIYTSSALNGQIIKQTIVHHDTYIVDHNFTGLDAVNNVSVLWSDGILATEKNIKDDLAVLSLFVDEDDTYNEEFLNIDSINENISFSNRNWAGLKTKYFMKAITSKQKVDEITFISKGGNNLYDSDFIYSDMIFSYNNIRGPLLINSYIGPIDTKYLENEDTKHLVQLFGFGWFIIGYLGKLILIALMALHEIIPNYGVICILFAFIIRLVTGPLTKKSFVSNQKMQKIQPKMQKIQSKFKDDKAKLNQAIIELYKTEGVNPLGGCLPILIQMPLLIALFQVFRKTIEFRGASFLPIWITDLSQPDVIIHFAFLENIPLISYFFGHGIALLPIIMGVVMFMNMKMTATSMQGSQASTMYIMNGFFILLFNTFPSGLNLYYTVYNGLNYLQQKKLKKLQN